MCLILAVEKVQVVFGDETGGSGKHEVFKSGCSPPTTLSHTGSLEPKQYLFQLQRANALSLHSTLGEGRIYARDWGGGGG